MQTSHVQLTVIDSHFDLSILGLRFRTLSTDLRFVNFGNLSYLREIDSLLLSFLLYVNQLDTNTTRLNKIIKYSVKDAQELISKVRVDIRTIAVNTTLEINIQSPDIQNLSDNFFKLYELTSVLDANIN